MYPVDALSYEEKLYGFNPLFNTNTPLIGVDFEKILYSKGNYTGNLLLKPNDVIYFPKKDFTVTTESQKNIPCHTGPLTLLSTKILETINHKNLEI